MKKNLKPLHSITEDHKTEVCRLAGFEYNEGFKVHFVEGAYRQFIDLDEFQIIDYYYHSDSITYHPLNNVVRIIEFLKLKGYAL